MLKNKSDTICSSGLAQGGSKGAREMRIPRVGEGGFQFSVFSFQKDQGKKRTTIRFFPDLFQSAIRNPQSCPLHQRNLRGEFGGGRGERGGAAIQIALS